MYYPWLENGRSNSSSLPDEILRKLPAPLTEAQAKEMAARAAEVIEASVGHDCPDCRYHLMLLDNALGELEEAGVPEGWLA